MSGNTDPIFSRVGDVEGSAIISAAAADYTGQGVNNMVVYNADPTNGSFVQRLRFKAVGTNIQTCARIYINNGNNRFATALSAVSGTPTGTPSASGGTLASGNYYAKIYAIDQYGGYTAASTETAAVAVTGPTGSITWNWTAVTGAVKYVIVSGMATNNQVSYFESTTNSYTQTGPGTAAAGSLIYEMDFVNNNYFYGEVTLPATTTTTTSNAAAVDIDYPMNFALAPGQSIIVGLSVAVAAGWVVTTIAGRY